MTERSDRLRPVFACGWGLVMAGAGGIGGPSTAGVSALLAVGAVLAGFWLRPMATVAVLLAVTALVLSDPPVLSATLCGLTAVAYLLTRYAAAVTVPTVVAAVSFGVVGLVAAAFPLRVPWLPLLAAPAILGCYLVAVRPFLSERAHPNGPRG